MGAVEPNPKRKLATIGILVGLLLSALDGTVIATALPQILEDLNGFTLYFLPNALFMLCQTVSMPIWGRLSDLYGRGRLHLPRCSSWSAAPCSAPARTRCSPSSAAAPSRAWAPED